MHMLKNTDTLKIGDLVYRSASRQVLTVTEIQSRTSFMAVEKATGKYRGCFLTTGVYYRVHGCGPRQTTSLKLTPANFREMHERVMAFQRSNSNPFRVEPNRSGHFIIAALDSSGAPKPSAKPHVHGTLEEADAEAKRLASKHPGQTFIVYRAVTSNVAQGVVTTNL